MSGSRRGATVVCPVLPWPPTGGAQKRTLRLLEAMERAGVTPHVLTPDATVEAGAALRARGWSVEVAAAPPPSLSDRIRQHASRRPSPYLADVARRLRAPATAARSFVQIEHVMAGYYFDAHPSAPVALSTHNVDSEMLETIARDRRPLTVAWARDWNRSRATATTERRTARRADAVLCVSAHDAAHFARLGARTVLAPNGVDDEVFSIDEPRPGREQVLFFGRLDYPPNDHGLRRFLDEVWPLVAAERPAARLRVVGAGLGGAASAALARSQRAEAVGMVPDILEELAGCSVVVVPIWQGGGTRLKVLEALGAGRPIVGTPLGVSGIGVEDGIDAYVAEGSRDFASATTRLLGDAPAARRLAANGRALAEGYRWSVTMAPASELYARWSQTRD